jgi:hypothetical protein
MDYKWKNMIGAPEFRPSYDGWWYRKSSNGFGSIEFLQLCEKLGVVAVPDLSSYESPEDMIDYVQYTTGTDETNEWVRRRIADGHPAPYDLQYIEIGNEERVNDDFAARFNAIANAIWSVKPEMQLIVGDFEYKKVVEDPYHLDPATSPSRITTLAPHQCILENAMAQGKAGKVWFDIHWWSQEGNQPTLFLDPAKSFYSQLNKLVPGSEAHFCVFELNANAHDFERALANAYSIIEAHNFNGAIPMMASANCLQVQDQNDNEWNQGLLFLNNRQVWTQAPGYVERMFSDVHQPNVIAWEGCGAEKSGTFNMAVTASVRKIIADKHDFIRRISVLGSPAHRRIIFIVLLAGEVKGRGTADITGVVLENLKNLGIHCAAFLPIRIESDLLFRRCGRTEQSERHHA